MTVDLHKYEHADACTCCLATRPIMRVLSDAEHEWMHASDAMFATTLHAHVDRASSSCDGPFYSDHVTRPNTYREGVLDDPTSEYDFKAEVTRSLVSWFRPGGTLEVSEHRVTWNAPTDEGYENEEVTWCTDAGCAYEGSHQRDVFAEAMGY